ncbi:MAG: S8 family serine peptidase [Fimbriimonadaceae bacterium]
MSSSRITLLVALLLMPLVCFGEGYARYFFDERVSLSVKPGEFVVAPFPGQPVSGERVSVEGFFRTNQVRQSWAPLATFGTRDFMLPPRYATPVYVDSFGEEFVPLPRIMVRFDYTVTPDEAEFALASIGGLRIAEENWHGVQGQYLLVSSASTGQTVLRQAEALALRPDVVYAEPDALLKLKKHQIIPNDPRFDEQWALWNTGQSGGLAGFDLRGPLAWEKSTGESSVITVIFDDGVQFDHPDINAIPGETFSSGSTDFGEPNNSGDNHGTAVAGVLAAVIDNDLGIAGIAGNSVVASAKLGDSIGNSINTSSTLWANAIYWAESIGAKVTNASLGVSIPLPSVATAYAETADTLIHFSSTGNSGNDDISFPANDPNVIAVGSSFRSGERSSFSTYGPEIELVAPGSQILTLDRTGADGYNSSTISGDYHLITGTSFSSPYAAGVAALVLSVNPDLPPAQVAQIMRETARDMGTAGFDEFTGYGMVDANAAVDRVAPPELLTIDLDPVSIEGGQVVEATVTLDGSAPIGGSIVTIASSDEAVALPVESILIPEGQSDGMFEISTFEVDTDTTVDISATLGDSQLVTGLSVLAPALFEASITVPGYAAALSTLDITVTVYESGTDTVVDTIFAAPTDAGLLELDLGLSGVYDIALESESSLKDRNTVDFDSTSSSAFTLVLGDIDDNGVVGSGDFLALVAAWRTSPGDSNWNQAADLDGGGTVGSADYLLLVQNWGKEDE